ncbi:MAG: hypothetical protein Q7W45_18645 [Bacteroidota bacterium]|nr:hypothetical protein [Bacteroidota bacterium]MDP3145662.1 hypothetical protein [Bacteroidota bacterium]MDP3558664.1 hypothetical protein [Bacteroidota bacterium]
MKKQTGIWIDGSKAIIVKLDSGNETISEIESNIENRIYHEKEGDKGNFSGNQHMNNEKKFDERRKHQLNDFLQNVLDEVKETKELYVFGPSETKTKLQNKIESSKTHTDMKLVSTETSDSMTTNQIVAKVKEFFKA